MLLFNVVVIPASYGTLPALYSARTVLLLCKKNGAVKGAVWYC
jgi:hypothetical protein